VTQYAMTIGGERVAGTRSFPVTDPATGQVFAVAPDCSDAELERAVAAAGSAFATWRAGDDARRQVMRAAADRIEAHASELGALMTQEQGKPVGEATGEVMSAVQWLRFYADLESSVQVLQDSDWAHVELLRHPIGPVAAITPWNAPIGLAFWKIAPALRAGNTLVVKPSPYTPLSSLKVGEILADVLPDGVLNVISGQDPLGAKLSAHPEIRKISFTGSTASGRKVAVAAAEDLKRVTLELGGNDPAIVLEDADVEMTAAAIFGSSMTNVGQICVAVKRAYVHHSLYDDVVSALAERAKGVRLGHGLDEGVTHGPLVNKPQLDRVAGMVDAAVHAGATIAAGGQAPEGPGYFHAPTILTDVTDDMAIVADEQFGPALPVLPYRDLDEAIARANATHFGLGSSVWTADVERGAEIAARIAAGTTWVNAHLYLLPDLPFGGVKSSGIGIENGIWGLHEFTTMQVVYRNLTAGTPWS
jgi:acyl-CoA reductase-like NAD-dependent aldehyde dehydrogenase